MSTPPWTKELKDLKRYDWLTACGVADAHFDKPRDLRVANCLMQHMNAETGISFPSQETLSKWARCASDRNVRDAIESLERSGAVKRKRMQDLQPETLDIVQKLGHRTMRAVVYKLNMFWAFETFETYKFKMDNGVGSARQLIATRMQHRPDAGRYDRSGTGRYKPAYDRPTNTVEDTVDTLGSAGSEKDTHHPIVGKEGDIDPFILVQPDDPDQARLWLLHIVSDKSRLAWALGLMAEDKLTPEIIRELAA
jgi:hypothetical protein